MGNTDLSAFKDLFIKTALENIAEFKEGMKKLSQNLTDPIGLEKAHRSIHTLKSKSLVMGYISTGTVSKLMQDILYDAVKGKRQITAEDITFLTAFIPKLEESINSMQTKNQERDFSTEITLLEQKALTRSM